MAYYSVFSMGPLIVVVISIASLVLKREGVQRAVVDSLTGLLGNKGGEAINTTLQAAGEPSEGIFATVIGTATLIFAALGVNTPQFDWARNRLPRRPRPLAPILQPEAIAGVVQHAIRTTPRELWVGLPVLKTILGALLIPGMLGTYLARKGYDGQLSEEPASADGDGNLFAAASTGYAIRGRFAHESKSNVVVVNPAALRAAVAVAVCAAAVLVVCSVA